MNKAYALISAAAVAAVMAAPAVAQDLPLNNTVAGGQGDVQLDGQALPALGGLSVAGATIAAVAVVAIATVAGSSGSSTSTTD